ncbi:hypothetical protein BCR34DRAFT_592990 [Clohesyomyces aquaticus]|uniref:Uncharacterized protein n=1 Tax=Clohesyomyces aquaticus TaxID=1231657 RepID=A0A1Y1YMB9_9PLEO|nr:hypothetical protein BCR34DRAFT_592990 [Clohesyomyces aquaticus]
MANLQSSKIGSFFIVKANLPHRGAASHRGIMAAPPPAPTTLLIALLPLAAAVPATPGQAACAIPANGGAPLAGASDRVESGTMTQNQWYIGHDREHIQLDELDELAIRGRAAPDGHRGLVLDHRAQGEEATQEQGLRWLKIAAINRLVVQFYCWVTDMEPAQGQSLHDPIDASTVPIALSEGELIPPMEEATFEDFGPGGGHCVDSLEEESAVNAIVDDLDDEMDDDTPDPSAVSVVITATSNSDGGIMYAEKMPFERLDTFPFFGLPRETEMGMHRLSSSKAGRLSFGPSPLPEEYLAYLATMELPLDGECDRPTTVGYGVHPSEWLDERMKSLQNELKTARGRANFKTADDVDREISQIWRGKPTPFEEQVHGKQASAKRLPTSDSRNPAHKPTSPQAHKPTSPQAYIDEMVTWVPLFVRQKPSLKSPTRSCIWHATIEINSHKR